MTPSDLLSKLLFASRASSNHHRLALKALDLLRGPDAQRWRDVFLHHHDAYLDGAKAPDDVFRDFKNHVLHVREGEWGGAVAAAEAWYGRMVSYFAAGRYREGVYAAGVMSHYLVDPFQPFHTHQTEEETALHRPVEQSFSKSYGAFVALIEGEFGGWPLIETHGGPSWLGDVIRAGANAATGHYETILDHYDLAAGAKTPAAGLDDTLRRAIAGLVAQAAAGLAATLDRGFAEAAITPPAMIPSLDLAFAAIRAPIHLVANRIEDLLERQLVLAQYEEYLRDGRVRATLSEDDRTVRALHAAEVLKIDVDALEGMPARKTGQRHGEPLKPRVSAEALRVPPVEAPAVRLGACLQPEAPVEDAPAIGPRTADRLEAIGVRTVAQLLALDPEDAAKGLDARHIRANTVADWQAMAALACALPELRSIDARLLLELDLRTAEALVDLDPEMLHLSLLRAFAGLPADEVRGAKPPTPDRVSAWVAAAAIAPVREAPSAPPGAGRAAA